MSMSDETLVVTTVDERLDLGPMSQDCDTALDYEDDEQLIVEITEEGDKHQELHNGNLDNADERHANEDETENNDMEQVIDSEIFREELEEMVAEHMSNNVLASNQPLLDILSIRQRFCRADGVSKQVAWAVLPVADIRGVETSNYAKNEKLMRSRLASCYRLVDLFEWTDGFTSGCVTARIDEETEGSYLLVAPQYMVCDEVSASSLVKVSISGSEVLDGGSTQLGIDEEAFAVHSALYSASNRTDVKCIMHLTCTNAVTLSIMKCGLLPLCSEAMTIGDVSYAEFSGLTEDLGEALGPTNKVLVLRNRGIMICGSSVEESFHLAFNVMSAVDVQITLATFGLDKVHLPSEDTCRNIYDNHRRPPVGATGTKRRWRRGELEFEAMMRQLDNVGCQTGYVYHDIAPIGSLAKRDRSSSDAELAPFLSGAGSFGGSDRELSRIGGSPLKIPKRSATPCEWRASPTVYNREQIVEKTFDRQEKKITKWVPADTASASKSAAAALSKLENPNQFAPQGINPAELKEKVKAIRRDYFNDRVSAGPQSRILEGINWNEAQAMKDNAANITSESTISGVTAVSKGVIQREHQHTATVLCKNLFDPPNPFNRMSGDDLELYKSNVEHKVRPGGDGTQDESDAHLVNVGDDNEQ